ncbi:MAG TPA: GNAT family N-acetyltransferase [Streptosporangiaceae bacterium]|nr:GNAT family N-acetyltransferase [Streptosporangiaceae bacterium]
MNNAEPRDAAAMADLFLEMDRFYGETTLESADAKVHQIESALFTNPPLAYALLAWDRAELVGIAAYSFLWPAALTSKSLYLKELYVRLHHRRKGVGKMLMQHVFQVARDRECSRVEWTTDKGNANAQNFYKDLGIQPNSSKIFYWMEIESSTIGR